MGELAGLDEMPAFVQPCPRCLRRAGKVA
jgi:hypothetical protein